MTRGEKAFVGLIWIVCGWAAAVGLIVLERAAVDRRNTR